MADGEEGEEIVVSTLRVGMKREFAMMMKSQAECGISITQGRVTRSKASVMSNSFSPKSGGSSAKLASSEGLNGKKRKKELKSEALGVVKLNGVNDVENVAFNGAGSVGKKGVVGSEEQERKRDVVCGIWAEERKRDGVEGGASEGEGKGVVGVEKVGGDAGKNVEEMRSEGKRVVGVEKIGTNTVMNVEEMGTEGKGMVEFEKVGCNAVKNVEEMGSDVANLVCTGERVESVVENVNKRGNVIGESGNSVTPSRRVTRSMLQSSVEASVPLGAGDKNICKENGDSRKPSRRVTRSMSNTRIEGSVMEDEKSEVLENDAVNPVSNSPKLEMKMSKKVELTNSPATLEDLLGTGLLEGLHVRYARGSKAGMPWEDDLFGEIKGSGILCFCDECKGTQVVTPSQFESHAGSGNNNPAEFAYLENGRTLCDVLTVCKDASSDWVERVIQISLGRVNAKQLTGCMRCKGSLPKLGTSGRMLCDSCMAPRKAQVCPPNNGSAQCSSPNISREPLPNPTESNDITAGSLLPVSPPKPFVKVPSGSHSRSKGQGKPTRKDQRLHKLVFESDMLPDGTQLAYYARGKKMREGYKSGHGIYCNCCHEVVSASTFEAHAGFASRRKPYMYIYTSNGVSLHELSIEIKKTLMLSTDENDDVCSICEGAGELLCCDNCPRSFHKECIDLPSIPQDRWYCRYCENMFQKESFVAYNVNAVAAGRIAGIDPFEEIKKRCIRIVETLEAEDGGCVLCRGRDFSKLGFGPRTVILCDQCEREFHIGCLKEHNMGDLQDLPDEWFCCKECSSMHFALQQLVKDGEKMLPDSMLSIISKKRESTASEGDHDLKVTWRLLQGKVASEDDRKWLSGAVSVFHDRFDPIGHSNAKRNDLIPFMIYGRSDKEQDFGGMYCAVLVLNSSVVSAGIFRIFGRQVAEIPLVATSNDCQGKGYFQSLFGCIENLLTSLDVKDLVLPAAIEAEEIWRNKFGFERITADQLNTYRKDYPMMIFQGTSILHKSIPKREIPSEMMESILKLEMPSEAKESIPTPEMLFEVESSVPTLEMLFEVESSIPTPEVPSEARESIPTPGMPCEPKDV